MSLLAVTLGALAAVGGGVASAAEASSYGGWTDAGRSAAVTLPATGFPAGTLSLPGSGGGLSVSSGTGRPLGPSTPFGGRYGSAAPQPYVSTNLGRTSPLSTRLDFAADTPPSGWGFALGDIDAESVRIQARDAAGQVLPVSALGYQSSFDYAPADGTDLPDWDAGTGTLSGHGTHDPGNPLNNTMGASAWFEPSAAVASLEFTSTNLTLGSPQWQLWLAARTASVDGSVQTPSGEPVPDVPVELQTPAGDPVPGPGQTTTTDADGQFDFPAVIAAPVVVVVEPPDGATTSGPVRRPVDPATGDVDVPPFLVTPAASPSPSPSTSASPSPTASASPKPTASPSPTPSVRPTESLPPSAVASAGSSTEARAELPQTGVSGLGELVGVAVLLLISGIVLVLAGRVRQTRPRD